MHERPTDLCRLLETRATAEPDRIGWRYVDRDSTDGITLTYGELERRSAAIAAALDAHRVGGARIVLWLPNGLQFLAAFFGVLRAGASAVPLAYSYSRRGADRLAKLMHDVDPVLVLTTRSVLRSTELVRGQSEFLSMLPVVCIEDLEGDSRLPTPGRAGWRHRSCAIYVGDGLSQGRTSDARQLH